MLAVSYDLIIPHVGIVPVRRKFGRWWHSLKYIRLVTRRQLYAAGSEIQTQAQCMHMVNEEIYSTIITVSEAMVNFLLKPSSTGSSASGLLL